MTTGGLESIMAREDCSQPTMCSWMSERQVGTVCVNSFDVKKATDICASI